MSGTLCLGNLGNEVFLSVSKNLIGAVYNGPAVMADGSVDAESETTVSATMARLFELIELIAAATMNGSAASRSNSLPRACDAGADRCSPNV
jgi:hypothetical protein